MKVYKTDNKMKSPYLQYQEIAGKQAETNHSPPTQKLAKKIMNLWQFWAVSYDNLGHFWPKFYDILGLLHEN